MKKILFYLVMLFLLGFISYKAFFYFDKKSEQAEIVKNQAVTRLSSEEIAQIQEGDFILRRGFGFFSDYISKELNNGEIDVTHAGIITKRNDSLFVIHSLSSDVTDIDGLQIQPLQEFLKYSYPQKIIITRLKNANPAMGLKISSLAENYLAKHIPFDHKGNFDNDEELFCTEMIWKILEKDLQCVELPSEAKARKDFFFSMMPMYDTKYFDIKVNQYKIKNK
ncbi:YiiX/YebB-like N1pC/P60 family cysteine hydrolase [uncultured Flavobacterium sp.]|uniref:YiiX/YebB-like N1pC/P60 family cysteine hydrolase n=1 Tax=uncultured Flavobacterium sp. TaxID=165435 RepID=UPI0025D7FEFA|nr:YiiX/YebB-like N1pC/P60 family cysteine hydrolase [uncultured Flavobacterium sp.]